MELFSDIFHTVAAFVVVLTVLVFVHEWGHYWVARKCGVRVDVFSIGFGPEIFGWTDSVGTRWKVSWVPLGGYVKFFGDANAASAGTMTAGISPEERSKAFAFKPVGQRAAVVAAGPIANFLFAIIILAGFFTFVGQPYTPPEVGEVVPGSAAEAAGFQPGDRVVSINGSKIDRFLDMQQLVGMNPGGGGGAPRPAGEPGGGAGTGGGHGSLGQSAGHWTVGHFPCIRRLCSPRPLVRCVVRHAGNGQYP
jgi:regulator of sigma E protease